MIVFDLRCAGGHVFEAWFGSSAAYADQQDRGLVHCPVCNNGDVKKAVMAPAVGTKANAVDVSRARTMLLELARVQAKALEQSTWVGGDFATRARAMHDGVEPTAIIHGQATPGEARALVDDGIPVAALPLPVIPPEKLN